MNNTLPEPPQQILLQEDYEYGNLDLRQPRDAAAYLKAASHYLSSWPQDWSAERLCLALLCDEEEYNKESFEDRQQIKPWEVLLSNVSVLEDPFLYVEELIMGLAEDFVQFSKYDFKNQSGDSNSL
jgi:hypothetical protein